METRKEIVSGVIIIGWFFQFMLHSTGKKSMKHLDLNNSPFGVNLKKATKAGCFGIGELNLFYQTHESDTLFDFFKRRIPPENHIQIEEILKEFNLEEYNEMELLKLTKGRLNTDRYYLEEV